MSFRLQQMKLGVVVLLLAFTLTLVSRATAASAGIRAEYDAILKLADRRHPEHLQRDSDEALAFIRARARELHDRGMAFIAAHQDSPLRWDVVVQLRYGRNLEPVVQRDGSKILLQPAVDRSLWNQRYFAMLEDLLDSTDASPPTRREALAQLIDHYSVAVRQNVIDNPRKGIVPALLEWTDELYSLDPQSRRLVFTYQRVAHMLNALDPAQCRAFLDNKKTLHSNRSESDVAVRRMVENFHRLMRNQDRPATELWEYLQRIEPALKDMAPYRGKVVIIRYLAVDWTSHTMELEELYQKYHDAGLEIIQVAYHNQNIAAPPVQRDKAAMERYAAEKQWPWRVLWATEQYPNQFPSYWAQGGFPCSLVIGRDGRIVREVPGELAWKVMLPRELFGPAGKR